MSADELKGFVVRRFRQGGRIDCDGDNVNEVWFRKGDDGGDGA